MIVYDYEIKRYGKNGEIETFKPDKIPKELDNIVYIEGPNSSGKSTFLNLLALGLHGLDKGENEIAEALKRKMEHLLNRSRQKVTFNIILNDKKNKINLVIEKKDPETDDIDIYEIVGTKKNRIGKDLFLKKYNLIYDIPENPLTRISQLTSEVDEMQRRYGERVENLKSFIGNIIRDIASSSDPNKIKDLNFKIKEKEKNIYGIKNEIKSSQELLELLEKSTYAKYYSLYNDLRSKAWNKLMVNKQTKNEYKIKKQYSDQDYTTFYPMLLKKLSSLKDIQTNLSNLFYSLGINKTNAIVTFSKLKLEKASEDLSFPQTLDKLLTDIRDEVSIFKDKFEKESSYKQTSLYRELITVLEKYLPFDHSLPGVNKTITELINDLKNSLKEEEVLIKKIRDIENLFNFLNEFNANKNLIEIEYFNTLREIKKEKGELFSKQLKKSSELQELEDKHEEYKDKSDYYKQFFIDKGGPDPKKFNFENKTLKNYSKYNEEELLSKISELSGIIKDKNKELLSLNSTNELFKNELNKLKNAKPHKYRGEFDKLNILFEKADELQAKLRNKFSNYLNYLKNPNTSLKIPESQKEYNKSLFRYLGRRIEFYRHINKEYVVDQIDLIRGVLVTNEGKEIYFNEMGTGQSQSAYLLSKLNTPDNRTIIALFDEVAMMDEESLSPIFNKCGELYKKGKLLAAIIVQKAKNVKVESKTPE